MVIPTPWKNSNTGSNDDRISWPMNAKVSGIYPQSMFLKSSKMASGPPLPNIHSEIDITSMPKSHAIPPAIISIKSVKALPTSIAKYKMPPIRISKASPTNPITDSALKNAAVSSFIISQSVLTPEMIG